MCHVVKKFRFAEFFFISDKIRHRTLYKSATLHYTIFAMGDYFIRISNHSAGQKGHFHAEAHGAFVDGALQFCYVQDGDPVTLSVYQHALIMTRGDLLHIPFSGGKRTSATVRLGERSGSLEVYTHRLSHTFLRELEEKSLPEHGSISLEYRLGGSGGDEFNLEIELLRIREKL